MKTLELKADIFKSIDTLGKSKLYEIKGYLKNLEQREIILEDWHNLSDEQKTRLQESIAKLDSGEFSDHKTVIEKLRNKIENA